MPPDSSLPNKEAAPRRCPTVVVSDDPSDDDFLGVEGNRPHENLARAIAELIVVEKTAGKAIALEGTWGSGKSTVLRLLKKELSLNAASQELAVRVVTFDSWAHEADPLRRSFIETVLDQLGESADASGESSWLDETAKQEILSRLTERRTRTGVSPWGDLLAISATLSLLGLALLPRDWISSIEFWPLGFPEPRFVIPLLLGATPLVARIFRGLLLRQLWNQRESDDKNSLFTNATNVSVGSADPTTVEFVRLFDQMMGSTLSGKENRRLVLVLDNLDRLSRSDEDEAWSTLQSLLQDGMLERRSWLRHVWLLVPYDPTKFRQEPRDSSDGRLAKVFSVRFRVAPPLLADRRMLLKRYLERALPEHRDSNEIDNICRIFDYYVHGRDTNRSATIRELKLFVNAIGSLHRQHQHTVPVSHMACFVLLLQHPETLHSEPSELARRVALNYDSLPIPTFLKEGQPIPIFDSLLLLSFGLANREAIVMFFVRGLVRTGDARTLQTILGTNDVNQEIATAHVETVVQEIENSGFAAAAAAIVPNAGGFTPNGRHSVLLQLVHKAIEHGTLDLNPSFLTGLAQLCSAAPDRANWVLTKLFRGTRSLTTSDPGEWVPSLIELTRIAKISRVENARFKLPHESLPSLVALCGQIVAADPEGNQWQWFIVPTQVFYSLSRGLIGDKMDDGLIALLLLGHAEKLTPPLDALLPPSNDPSWKNGSPNTIQWTKCLWALSEAGVSEATSRLHQLFRSGGLGAATGPMEEAIRFLIQPDRFGVNGKHFAELHELVELYGQNLKPIVEGLRRNGVELPAMFLEFATTRRSRHIESLRALGVA